VLEAPKGWLAIAPSDVLSASWAASKLWPLHLGHVSLPNLRKDFEAMCGAECPEPCPPALCSMLHLTGYELTMDELKNFRQVDSRTAGHPENTLVKVGRGVKRPACGACEAQCPMLEPHNTPTPSGQPA
jgi:hypothetical protein